MGAIPDAVETGVGPPVAIPLRHVLLGLAALVASAVLGIADTAGVAPGTAVVAARHLFLAGWVCLTIMGAMIQFVPVWSGVELHSRRLAALQPWLLAVGLAGFATALLAGAAGLIVAFGTVMLAGFWTFVYNVSRTLPRTGVTERHFAIALGFFVVVPILGISLAASYHAPVFGPLRIARPDVVAAHATLAVFGAVLTPVAGALSQLGPMFTGMNHDRVDESLLRAETVGYPVGVLALAGGRLVDSPAIARVGGVLVVFGLCSVAVVLGRKLLTARTAWTPVLSRYCVFVVATAAWAAVTLPAWLARPTARTTLLGGPGGASLLAVGVVGFVVAGTLYHVVPFLVWIERYSDLVGFEDVPMVDDLYDARLARLDLIGLLCGVGGSVVVGLSSAPTYVALAADTAFLAGASLFVANLALVVRNHGADPLRAVVFSPLTAGRIDE